MKNKIEPLNESIIHYVKKNLIGYMDFDNENGFPKITEKEEKFIDFLVDELLENLKYDERYSMFTLENFLFLIYASGFEADIPYKNTMKVETRVTDIGREDRFFQKLWNYRDVCLRNQVDSLSVPFWDWINEYKGEIESGLVNFREELRRTFKLVMRIGKHPTFHKDFQT